MKRSFFFLFIPLFTCICSDGKAQSAPSNVISPAGGYSKTSDYSLEWTVGEPVATTYLSADNVYTQGFNQCFVLIKKVTRKNPHQICKVTVAPNPVLSSVNVYIETSTTASYSLAITDVTGLNVYQRYRNLNSQNFKVDISRLANGLYILQVYDHNYKLINTTRLIKL